MGTCVLCNDLEVADLMAHFLVEHPDELVDVHPWPAGAPRALDVDDEED